MTRNWPGMMVSEQSGHLVVFCSVLSGRNTPMILVVSNVDEDTSRYNLTSQEADRILDAYQKECEELEAHAKESSNLRSRSEPALASCLTQPSPDQHQTIPENSAPKDNGDVAPQNPSTTGAEKSADVEHRITPTTTQMEPEIQNGEPKEQLSLTSHSSHSSKGKSQVVCFNSLERKLKGRRARASVI